MSIEVQIKCMTKLVQRGIELPTKCFLFPVVKLGHWLMIAVDCRNEQILLIRSSKCNYFNLNELVIIAMVDRLKDIFNNKSICISQYKKGTIIGDHSLYQCGAFITYIAKIIAKAKIMANTIINIEEDQTICICNNEDIDLFKLKILELLLSKMIMNLDYIRTRN